MEILCFLFLTHLLNLFAIGYGISIMIAGKVEYRRGRVARGIKARLWGLLAISISVAYFLIIQRFSGD